MILFADWELSHFFSGLKHYQPISLSFPSFSPNLEQMGRDCWNMDHQNCWVPLVSLIWKLNDIGLWSWHSMLNTSRNSHSHYSLHLKVNGSTAVSQCIEQIVPRRWFYHGFTFRKHPFPFKDSPKNPKTTDRNYCLSTPNFSLSTRISDRPPTPRGVVHDLEAGNLRYLSPMFAGTAYAVTEFRLQSLGT